MNDLRAIILDTFQEARARWLFWSLFGLSTLLVSLFLFVLNIDLVEGARATLDIGTQSRTIYDIRKFVNVSYAWVSIVLYIFGTLLAVFASSGLVPVLLEPGRIALLLSKPIRRSTLLLGRFIGNVLIIAFNCTYLIVAVWLIIGAKTRIWEPRFLIAIPVSVFMFAVLLCIVVIVGVVLESAAVSVMIAVVTMLMSTLLAQRDWSERLLSSEWSRDLWTALYWIVPKVWDLGSAMKQMILYDRTVDWTTPVWSSALFGIAVLCTAFYIFQRRDF